jgi:DNA polymerase-3 subunit chi
MTETVVTFHFNVTARVPYLCRLLRKVSAAGMTAWVRVPPDELDELDHAMWTASQEDFLAHARVGQPEAPHSPILLSDGALPDRTMQVLVNCMPDFFPSAPSHARVVELVGTADAERAQARQRWRQYVQAGLTPATHDAAAHGG